MLEQGEENLTEHLINIKKQFLSFSKFYSKLIGLGSSGFLSLDRETQDMVLHDVYVNNSKLEHLLRDIHENELNGETLRKFYNGAGRGSGEGGGGGGTSTYDEDDEEECEN